ncbi:MAG: glycerate kinase [Propionibacteriaceae bacterium]|nr:glycerate kinase [Propionibacteriaceae bacterium]
MRILVCTDRIGALASADAGAALGRAFVAARPGTQVAVVPMAAGGPDLAAALAALGETAPVVRDPDAEAGHRHHDHVHGDEEPTGVDPASTSVGVGRALAAALASRPARVVVDLTGITTHDGGAGILAALGATGDVPLDAGAGGLAGLSRLDLAAARERVGDTELVAVVDPSELGDMLLGLRGLTSRRGRAAGTDPALMLSTDAALGALAGALGVPDAPGLGAAGGAALALVALGGWVTSGPALCAQVADLERTASLADVVVTGADHVDFATRGGAVVPKLAALGERVLRPVIVVARVVDVSGRELRTFGVEVAYPVGGESDLGSAELTERAAGVASSWTW